MNNMFSGTIVNALTPYGDSPRKGTTWPLDVQQYSSRSQDSPPSESTGAAPLPAGGGLPTFQPRLQINPSLPDAARGKSQPASQLPESLVVEVPSPTRTKLKGATTVKASPKRSPSKRSPAKRSPVKPVSPTSPNGSISSRSNSPSPTAKTKPTLPLPIKLPAPVAKVDSGYSSSPTKPMLKRSESADSMDSMRDDHSDDDDPGDACPTFIQPLLPAISIVVTLAVPALLATAALLANYSGASMTAAFIFPLVGVFSFLVAPLSVRRAELTEDEKEKDREEKEGLLLNRLTKSTKSLTGQARAYRNEIVDEVKRRTSGWCNDCVSHVLNSIERYGPQIIQLTMGILALIAAITLFVNLHRVPIMSAVIMGVCAMVQVCDCLGWLLGEQLNMIRIRKLRKRVNARKDIIEETCTQAADPLVDRTRALVFIVLRNLYPPPRPPPPGLTWIKSIEKTKGNRIENDGLERALKAGQLQFTREELAAFEITPGPLKYDSYVELHFVDEASRLFDDDGKPMTNIFFFRPEPVKKTLNRLPRWVVDLCDKVDNLGVLTRSSPLKCLVTLLNLIVLLDSLRAENLLNFLRDQARQAAKIPMPKLPVWLVDPMPTLSADRIWSAPHGWQVENSTAHRCGAGQPCQALGPQGMCPNPSAAWFPQPGEDKITLEYSEPMLVDEVAIHYQVIDMDGAGGGGGEAIASFEFALMLDMLGERYRVLVVSGSPGERAKVTVKGEGPDANRLSVFQPALFDRVWSLVVRDGGAPCPGAPVRLRIEAEEPVAQFSVSLDSGLSKGASIGIDAVLVSDSSKGGGGDDGEDTDRGDMEDIASKNGEEEFEELETDSDVEVDVDVDAGATGAEKVGGEYTTSNTQSTTGGTYQNSGSYSSGAGGGTYQMPPLGVASAAGATLVTAAATTEFVRKKIRPEEHEIHETRENEKKRRRARRGRAQDRVETALMPPVEAKDSRAAILNGRKAGLDSMFLGAAETISASELATEDLNNAIESAGNAGALDHIRSGGTATVGPVGTAIHLLHQAEDQLTDAIEEGQKQNLPKEKINEARTVLGKVKSMAGRAGEGVDYSNLPKIVRDQLAATRGAAGHATREAQREQIEAQREQIAQHHSESFVRRSSISSMGGVPGTADSNDSFSRRRAMAGAPSTAESGRRGSRSESFTTRHSFTGGAGAPSSADPRRSSVAGGSTAPASARACAPSSAEPRRSSLTHARSAADLSQAAPTTRPQPPSVLRRAQSMSVLARAGPAPPPDDADIEAARRSLT